MTDNRNDLGKYLKVDADKISFLLITLHYTHNNTRIF